MYIGRFLLIIALAVTMPLPVIAGISLSQSVSATSLQYEDSAVFEIILEWSGPQWGYRFDKPLNPDFDRLRVKGFSSSIRSTGDDQEEVTTKVYRYTLEPISAGLGRIDPVTVSYLVLPDSIPGELMTEAISMQIAEPVRVTKEETGVPTWFIIIIAALGLIVVGVIVVQHSRSRRADGEDSISPVERALGDLAQVKQESGSDMKKFQTGLCRLLGEYVRMVYSIDVDVADDDRLFKLLEQTNLSPAAKEKLGRWIIEARRDKFRPVESSPGDTIRLESEVRTFLEEMK